MSLGTETAPVVVARYGELWLKGKNRTEFERRLVKNVRHALRDLGDVRVQRDQAQLILHPATRAIEVAHRLKDVFGLSSVSLARGTDPQPEAIAEMAEKVLAEALEGYPRNRLIPFRVATKRADKRFPLVSSELDRFVADRVYPPREDRLRVDLSNPELTLGISVLQNRAYVYAQRLPGAGGLPVGSVGRTIALLSGGIDSPVAAWMTMKRGCEVVFLTFHSYPYIGASYERKVKALARSLARFQTRVVLHSVPFADIQTQIRDKCPTSYRTVLYRRMMQRIAERIARREDAQGVVTGDSLGQVASQTLENLRCIEAVAELPILRPLLGFDKSETVDLAREIGTFELSIQPEPDCCTVFQPKRPIIRGRVEVCEDAERELDVDGLVTQAVESAERHLL